MEVGDRELIRAARKGDGNAANELARRYWTGAWKASLALSGDRDIADDATQDAFERVLRNLSRLDDKRPFAAYLHRVVINRTLDLLRARSRTVSMESLPEPEDPGRATGSQAGVLADMGFVQRVAQLPEARRVPVVLRYLLDYSPAEIARILDLPEGTVNSRLSRGLQDLRERMEVER